MIPRNLLVGVGNLYRRDDGVGIVVVRQVRPFLPANVEVLECNGDLTDLLDAWQDTRCIVIDALHSGGIAGKVVRVEAHRQPIPTDYHFFSTHAFDLQGVINLGRMLSRLPKELVLYGIEGANFGDGEGLSPAVAQSVDVVVSYILQGVMKGGASA